MLKKTDTTFWDNHRGKIFTRKGGWIIGEAIYNHGYSMMDDLVGKKSFFQVLILNVTGKLPSRKIASWCEAVAICLNWPDHRIWCNQIGSLAGTLLASPVAGVTAGILASDSNMYGPGTVLAANKFIREALLEKIAGRSAEKIIENHHRRKGNSSLNIIGYARPVATGDERVFAMKRVTEQLGFSIGEHLKLAYEIESLISEKHHESMNMLGFIIPFLCDNDFSADDQYRIFSTCVNSGVLACYSETADNPSESFFPLRCNDIDYQGKTYRKVPNKN